MKVLEPPVARSTSNILRPLPPAGAQHSTTRLAAALTGAAAVAGGVEVLVERVAVPMLTHAVGPSFAPVAAALSRLGTIAVGATAVLVLAAALAWAAAAWQHHGIVAAAILITAATTLVAGLTGGETILLVLHVAVAATAIGVVVAWRTPGVRGIALVAVAVAIVVGQWSLIGWDGRLAVPTRAIAEAALVLALVLFAVSIAPAPRRRSLIGLTAGALVAFAALMAPRTALVVLWASGATLWMPAVVYIGAGAAIGFLLVNWVPERGTRHLGGGLALLAVAAIEPALVHHNLTALVALVALAAPTTGRLR